MFYKAAIGVDRQVGWLAESEYMKKMNYKISSQYHGPRIN